jgi:hypothetical protein
MRESLLAALLLSAMPAGAQDVVFTHLDVTARLSDAGELAITELLDVVVQGEVATLGRDFGLGVEQSVRVKSLVRLDVDGGEHPLVAGDVKTADRYAVYPTWIQWSVRDETAGPLPGVAFRYRLEYDLVNAIAPAWDLPNGPRPLDALSASYLSPLARAEDAWRVWKEAWPRLDAHYRLDHDVLLPGHDGSGETFAQLDYHLHWNDKVWRLVDPGRDIGTPNPGVDYRVRRSLERLAPGSPSAANVLGASRRLASGLILPVGVFFLWLVSKLLGALGGADQGPLGPALFQETVLAEPPELVAGRLTGSRQAPPFDSLLLRLASERKLAITTEPSTVEDVPPRTRLRLLVERGSLHPYEGEVIEAFFGEKAEVSSEQILARRKNKDFDVQNVVASAFSRALPPRPAGSRIAGALGVLLFVGGLAMSLTDLDRIKAEPYAPVAGIVGSALASLPLPAPFALTWLSLVGTLLQLVPNVPLLGLASVGVSVMVLAGYQRALGRVPSRGNPAGRRLADLQRLREWARKELGKPRPALLDAWIPHLEALGLTGSIASWRQRHASTSSFGAPDLADIGAGEALAGPAFSGERRPFAAPADPDWPASFYEDD